MHSVWSFIKNPRGRFAVVTGLGLVILGLIWSLALALSNDFTWESLAQLCLGLCGLIGLVVSYLGYKEHVRFEQLTQTLDATVFALACQAEPHDPLAQRHLKNISAYVHVLAREMAKNSAYKDLLTPAYQKRLILAVLLHDIGKVGIPDEILYKQGRLTPEERVIMEGHCQWGEKALHEARTLLPFENFLTLASEICLTHQEKWDGTGYPNHLQGDQIPLAGRLMCLADVYDALRTPRSYRPAIGHEECLKAILALGGTHFDPAVVEAFMNRQADFLKISELN